MVSVRALCVSSTSATFAGVVLVPNATLPLKLVRRSERALVRASLEAPPPFTRVIAVVRIEQDLGLEAQTRDLDLKNVIDTGLSAWID